MQPDSSPPQSNNYSENNKSTRKYVKTGKYSKKKQQQQQQQIQAAIQQQIQATLQQRQQPLTPQQILALQQSLQDAAMNGMSATHSGTQSPVLPSLSNQQLVNPSALLAKLLPQQNGDTSSSIPQMHQQQSSIHHQAQILQAMSDLSPSTTGATANLGGPSSISDPLAQLLSMDGGPGNKRSRELDEQHIEVKKRCVEALLKDHEKVSRPDYLTPFRSIEDAMDRLLPYHIYQYPAADLDANKVPLERQDQTMLDIYKTQKDVFDKHGKIITKALKDNNNMVHRIMLERCVLMDVRQKVNEEQTRVNEEQRAQQQALRTQAEVEKARLLQEQLQQQNVMLQQQQQYQQQYHQYQQQQQQQQQQPQSYQQPQTPSGQGSQPGQPLDVKYAQTLHALMQNREFAEQYQKLTPELQQQFLRNLNHDKVAEFLKRKV